jgi:hypothetical protein
MVLPRTIETLTDELAARWLPVFEPRSWSARLELLNEIHEQLRDDIGDFEIYSAVSRVFIRKLIEGLDGGVVSSAPQAHIYANSDDELHRRAAGAWLSRHARART